VEINNAATYQPKAKVIANTKINSITKLTKTAIKDISKTSI
jgi:hypothetical protein